jgi:hypothetical protein
MSDKTMSTAKASAAPRRVRANRSNALKSTGPKTARGKRFSSVNATQWGLTAGDGRHLMARLGEDPEAFDALLERLAEEWQPATETARQLVAQLAELFWKQARLARAEQALVARQVDELESDRAALSAQIGRAHSPAPAEELRVVGLWNQPDSPGKFEDLIANLGALAEEAEARRSTGAWEVHANFIWGGTPTVAGQAIRGLFHKFAEAEKPGAAPLDEEHVGTLVESLHQELRRARDAYRAWRERHVEITPAVLESAWAPTAPEWTLLIRQRNSVFRQIERTLRLLVIVAAAPALSGVEGSPPSHGATPLAVIPAEAGIHRGQHGPVAAIPTSRDRSSPSPGGGGDPSTPLRAGAAATAPSPSRASVGASPAGAGPAPKAKNCKTKPISFLESTKPQPKIHPARRIARPPRRSREALSGQIPNSLGEKASLEPRRE